LIQNGQIKGGGIFHQQLLLMNRIELDREKIFSTDPSSFFSTNY